jgi:nitrite reductase (NADH) small subunit
MSPAFAADWIDIGAVVDIPLRGARTVRMADGEEIAIFRTGSSAVYALVNACPHKQGPLSQGIVHGTSVTCPLHNWVISLETGAAQGEDKGCTPTIPLRVDAGRILIRRADALGRAAA